MLLTMWPADHDVLHPFPTAVKILWKCQHVDSLTPSNLPTPARHYLSAAHALWCWPFPVCATAVRDI
jgi:hypothetical protein